MLKKLINLKNIVICIKQKYFYLNRRSEMQPNLKFKLIEIKLKMTVLEKKRGFKVRGREIEKTKPLIYMTL